MKPVVVVPTFNERENIGRLLRELTRVRPPVDVLVVDDQSPDGTADVVRDTQKEMPQVHLLVRRGPRGLGHAYREGFMWALRHGHDAVVQMDADLSHPTSAIPALLDGLAHADGVLGSRYVDGGSTVGWPLRRRLLSRAANAYARSMLGLDVRDVTSGFRAYRASALRAIQVWTTDSDGYGFQVENTWRAHRRGLTLAEVPIEFTDRTLGRSKMSPAIALETLVAVQGWRRERTSERRAAHQLVAGAREAGLDRR